MPAINEEREADASPREMPGEGCVGREKGQIGACVGWRSVEAKNL